MVPLPIDTYISFLNSLSVLGYTHLDGKMSDIQFIFASAYYNIENKLSSRLSFSSNEFSPPSSFQPPSKQGNFEVALADALKYDIDRLQSDYKWWPSFISTITYQVTRPLNVKESYTSLKDWLSSDELGTSSISLAVANFGESAVKQHLRPSYNIDSIYSEYPRDFADFSRCKKLVDSLNINPASLINQLSEEWNAILSNWSKLDNTFVNNTSAFNTTLSEIIYAPKV